jgi:hypothetical protein
MNNYRLHIRTLFALLTTALVAISCASSEITTRRSYIGDEQLPRPGRIIVYDFAATAADVDEQSTLVGNYHMRTTPQTSEEIEIGRKLGSLVAERLVTEILAMGMPAERAHTGPEPGIGDLLIKGEFVSIDEGDRLKRMVVGFGAGAGELKTHVEGYQMTSEGLRLLGESQITDTGGKMPGMLVPVLGGAATENIGTAAIVSGSMNVVQELGPESMNAAAKRTAQKIGEVLSYAFKKHGWIQQTWTR